MDVGVPGVHPEQVSDNGKPIARWGRKATGPSRSAGLPNDKGVHEPHQVDQPPHSAEHWGRGCPQQLL